MGIFAPFHSNSIFNLIYIVHFVWYVFIRGSLAPSPKILTKSLLDVCCWERPISCENLRWSLPTTVCSSSGRFAPLLRIPFDCIFLKLTFLSWMSGARRPLSPSFEIESGSDRDISSESDDQAQWHWACQCQAQIWACIMIILYITM